MRIDLECWDADQVGKDDFLGMHRLYLGQYNDEFGKYVAHRRDFATIPFVALYTFAFSPVATALLKVDSCELQVRADGQTKRESRRIEKERAR